MNEPEPTVRDLYERLIMLRSNLDRVLIELESLTEGGK